MTRTIGSFLIHEAENKKIGEVFTLKELLNNPDVDTLPTNARNAICKWFKNQVITGNVSGVVIKEESKKGKSVLYEKQMWNVWKDIENKNI